MSAGSLFSTDAGTGAVYPSFQEPAAGAWGHTVQGQVERTGELNVPFDELAFQESKQNGCLPPPCKAYPSWPPPFGTGFIYPSLEKGTQETLLGEERGCFPMAAPFVDSQPILPSVNMPPDEFQGQSYSPSQILNMYNCLNTPQPLSNKCFGYMPYDATYMAANMAQGGQAKGWLDDPLAPVPITSIKQPLAVQTDIPSRVPSDRNDNYRPRPPGDAVVEPFVGGVRPLQPTVNPGYGANGNGSTGHGNGVDGYGANGVGGYGANGSGNALDFVAVIEVEGEDDDTCNDPSWSSLLPCMVKSLRGFMRDLFHPDRQPADDDTLAWLFRNNRPYYLVIFLLLVIAGCFFIHSLCGSDSQHAAQLFCIFVVAFLVYLGLPSQTGTAEAQKITSLFTLAVAIWALLWKVNV